MLAGLLDNDDELILLSQVCFGSDVPSFEKGFDLDTYTEEQSKASFRFYKDDIRNLCVELGIPTYIYGHMYVDSPLVRYTSAARAKRFGNASSNFVSACIYLTYRWKHIKKTYKSQISFIHSLTDSQRVASILNL